MGLPLTTRALRNKDGEESRTADGSLNYIQHDAWSLMNLMRSIDGIGQAPHMRAVMKLHDIFEQAWIDDAEEVELDDEGVTTLKMILGDPKGKIKEGDTILSDFMVQRTVVVVKDALGV